MPVPHFFLRTFPGIHKIVPNFAKEEKLLLRRVFGAEHKHSEDSGLGPWFIMWFSPWKKKKNIYLLLFFSIYQNCQNQVTQRRLAAVMGVGGERKVVKLFRLCCLEAAGPLSQTRHSSETLAVFTWTQMIRMKSGYEWKCLMSRRRCIHRVILFRSSLVVHVHTLSLSLG